MNTSDIKYTIKDIVYLLHDAPAKQAQEDGNTEILEIYFNDLYKLFLMKLSKFEAATNLSDNDKLKLRSLLDELINVKAMLID